MIAGGPSVTACPGPMSTARCSSSEETVSRHPASAFTWRPTRRAMCRSCRTGRAVRPGPPSSICRTCGAAPAPARSSTTETPCSCHASPILCDVRGPKEFAGETFKPDFGKIATPPLRGTFGTVPLSPVIAPIGPGRQLLVWFYHWHVGANMAETPSWPFITSEVPMVFVNFGKGPIVR